MATLLQGARWLNSTNFKAIVENLASKLERTRPLVYLDRLPTVPAFDDELTGRFTGSVIAADIIADDQEATVEESGKVELVTATIPNLKKGQRIGQAKLNLMQRLEETGGRASEEDALEEWENMLAENLIYGNRQRQNAIACAMMLDAFNYNRLGVNISGATWGMPSGLKITPSVLWTVANAATMKPISDLLNANNYASQTYGITYNRVTMSTAVLDIVIGSTQFKERAAVWTNPAFVTPASGIATEDRKAMSNILGRIVGMEVVIDDATLTERSNAGTKGTRRYLPESKVLLDIKENDGDGRVWDWANAIVTESIVADLAGGVEGLGGPAYGPIGYYTRREDLNPPDVTAWCVSRGFARKHVVEATAVLTVYT